MSWHVEPGLLEAYAEGAVDETSSFSVEAHLLACASCRAGVARQRYVDRERLEGIWTEVQEVLDAPRRTPIERLLVFFGVSDERARLLAATPSLTVSWFAAAALALGFAVLAAHGGERGLVLFLALAPLLPVAGVAAAYGPGIDPAYEIGVASPMRSFELLFVRAAAVLASTTLLAGAASLGLPRFDWTVVAWLLPSLSLTVCSLALATFVSPLRAAALVALAWIGVVILAGVAASDELAVFEAGGQIVFFIATLGAALLLTGRRDAFETRRHG